MSTTANVVVTQSGTGFLIDVTACNLDPSVQIKDFVGLTGNPPTVANQSGFTKISQSTVQYVGPALPANTRVEIRRRTQYDPYAIAQYQTFINFNDYNRELTRATRIFYEQALNGIGSTGNLANSVLDGVYSADWATDTLNTASRRRLYDQFELKFDKAGGTINGNVTITGTNGFSMTGGNATIGGGLIIAGATALNSTATVGSNPVAADISQNIASTAWIRNGLANGVWNIVCATPGAGSNNFDSANTAWVRSHLAGTPTLGATTVTAPAQSDNSTRVPSTAWVRTWVGSGQNLGAATVTTAALTANSTEVVNHAVLNRRLLLVAGTNAPTSTLTNNTFIGVPAGTTWTINKQVSGLGINFSTPSQGVFVVPATGWYCVTAQGYFFYNSGTQSVTHYILALMTGTSTVTREICRTQFSPAYTGVDNSVNGSTIVQLTSGVTYYIGYYLGTTGNYTLNRLEFSLEYLGS